ncbi:33472_t:CDS:2, partial [Gigaspora margarita]
LWAISERKSIAAMIFSKRKLTINEALSQNPCKIRGWPDHWRPHLTAWIRFKGKIEVMEIKIGELEGQHFSVQKALKVHIDPDNQHDCPNHLHYTQTSEHFALKCPLSRTIWKTVYKSFKLSDEDTIPQTFEDIFQATNIKDIKKCKAAIWLHITCIYEIWCWYTQAKWRRILSSKRP